METDLQRQEPHELRLEERKKLSVTGVQEVESFDEETVVMHTARGVLLVRGRELHLQTLSVEGGCVVVEGQLEALSYAEPQKRGGFFARLLR